MPVKLLGLKCEENSCVPKDAKWNPKYYSYLLLEFEITGHEYNTVDVMSHFFRSEHKRARTSYNKGVITNYFDPHKPTRIGLLGEVSFGVVSDEPVNVTIERKGDSYDFKLKCGEINIKFTIKLSANQYTSIIAENNSGYKFPINVDFYISGSIIEDCREHSYARVGLYCAFPKEYIISLEPEESKVPEYTHKNRHAEWKAPQAIPIKKFIQENIDSNFDFETVRNLSVKFDIDPEMEKYIRMVDYIPGILSAVSSLVGLRALYVKSKKELYSYSVPDYIVE